MTLDPPVAGPGGEAGATTTLAPLPAAEEWLWVTQQIAEAGKETPAASNIHSESRVAAHVTMSLIAQERKPP